MLTRITNFIKRKGERESREREGRKEGREKGKEGRKSLCRSTLWVNLSNKSHSPDKDSQDGQSVTLCMR